MSSSVLRGLRVGRFGLWVLCSVWLASTAHAGKGLGACPDTETKATVLMVKPGGKLPAVASGAFSMPGFKAVHSRNAKGEDAWLANLSGASHPNRVYTTGSDNVVVMRLHESCAAGTDCTGRLAYVAYAPSNGQWGATVFEGRNLRELVQDAGQTTLAVHKPLILDALSCIQSLDE